ncbi:uncharacterized protein [Nicotiana sylvestris]|uniref:uncharacterized protein n=1 Tax=Nicotiana sylvestris TaxID=4096 RepID=UPI00388C8224
MTWLIWNIRGLNKRYKQKEINQYIKDKHIKLAGLVETKVKEGNAVKIIWDEQVYTVQPLDKQDQFIQCLVTGKYNGMYCYLTVVYGHNDTYQRRNLCENIKILAQNTKGPWLIGGVFKGILTIQDKISKVHVTSADIKDLDKLCHDIGIIELPWRGDYFTWTNKHQGVDRVWSRIDGMFGNDMWMMNYSHLSTEYGEPNISDHNSMCINIRQPRRLSKSLFRFFNIWACHLDFEMIIREEWNRNKVAGKMEKIWVKLKWMKRHFRQLNEIEFKGVAEKIDQARQTIYHIQSQM